MPVATLHNTDFLRPDVLSNEIVEGIDQMEDIQLGDGEGWANATSAFPLVDLDDPDQAYYTMEGTRSPMRPVSATAESPIGTLDLPDIRELTIQSYKKKFAPEKGVETTLQNTPYSLFARAASVIRTELYLTREQVVWRGDAHQNGLIGEYGTEAHPEIPTDHILTPATPWSDTANATPYADISDLTHRVMTNGRMFNGAAMPTMFMSPATLRDLKQNEDFKDRLSGVQIQVVNDDVLTDLIGDEVDSMERVGVRLPRENENGELIDDDGTVVNDPNDAAKDWALDPYDPTTGEVTRNVVIARPGAGSAFLGWFSDRLTEHAQGVPPNGDMAVDNANGFITQIWTDNDPVVSWFKGMQELGFHIQRGENFAVLQGV